VKCKSSNELIRCDIFDSSHLGGRGGRRKCVAMEYNGVGSGGEKGR